MYGQHASKCNEEVNAPFLEIKLIRELLDPVSPWALLLDITTRVGAFALWLQSLRPTLIQIVNLYKINPSKTKLKRGKRTFNTMKNNSTCK